MPRLNAYLPSPDTAPHWLCHPRAKPLWVHREVVRLAVFLRGCRSIATTFNTLHAQRATVGHDFVAKVLRAHADEIAARRRGMRGAVPPAHRAGDAWAMDLSSVQAGSQRQHVLGRPLALTPLVTRPRASK